MKIHQRKKEYRKMIKNLASKGMINSADGKMIPRPASGNSMIRDYYPQNN